MSKRNLASAYIAAVIFTILTGFSFLGIKQCQGDGNQLAILTYRYNFAFIFALLVWIFGIFKSNLKKSRGKSKRKGLLAVTALAYISFMIFQVVGIFYTTSIVGSIIFAITPIIVQIIAAVVLKEHSNFKQNIFVILTIAALIYMILAGANQLEFSYKGVIYLMLANVSMAISNIGMRYLRNDFTPFDISMVISVLGFLIFNILTVAIGIKTGNLSDYFEPLKNIKFLIGTAYLGVGCILITSQLLSYMLSKLPAINATIFGNVGTAISIIAGIFILGEPFYIYHFICSMVIIVGVIGVSVCGDNGKSGKTSCDKTEK